MKNFCTAAYNFWRKSSFFAPAVRSIFSLWLICCATYQASTYQQRTGQQPTTTSLKSATLWQGLKGMTSSLSLLAKAAIIPALLYTTLMGRAAAQQTYTYKALGGPKDEFAFSMAPKANNNFYITGKSNSYSDSEGLYDLFLAEITPDLSTVSVNIFKNITTSTSNIRVSTIFPLSSGDFILASETDHRNIFPGYNLLVMRLNQTGQIVWSHIYGQEYNELFPLSSQPGIESSDGHVVLTGGVLGSSAPNGGDTFVMKLNVSNGAIIWEKRLGGIEVEYGTAITENIEEDLFIASLTSSFPAFPLADFIITKLTGNGSLIFSKAFSGEHLDMVSAMVPAADGGVFISGETRHNDSEGANDAFVGRLSSQGDMVWIKEFQFGGSNQEDAEAMIMDSDGNLIVTGEESNTDTAFIAKIDQNGTEIWVKTTNELFLVFERPTARGVMQLNDTFMVVGHGDFFDNPFANDYQYAFLWSVPLDGISETCSQSVSPPFVDIRSSISTLDVSKNITISVDKNMNQSEVVIRTESVTFDEVIFCPTPSPTTYPTQLPTSTTQQPSQNPTIHPTTQPTLQPSQNPTLQPTTHPTQQPSQNPTLLPTTHPTQQPSQNPTLLPTTHPTQQPSQHPTLLPSQNPTAHPSQNPTMQPTTQPTQQPSQHPTLLPSQNPTAHPSQNPTMQPTTQPTQHPSQHPTLLPSQNPTAHPSENPTMHPTTQPTLQPSQHPTFAPTSAPSLYPTNAPTKNPSLEISRKSSKKNGKTTSEKYFEFKDKGSSTLTYLTMLLGLSVVGGIIFLLWQQYNRHLEQLVRQIREEMKSEEENSLEDSFEMTA